MSEIQTVLEDIVREIAMLRRRVERLEVQESQRFVPLTTPYTSTSWDGDLFSTTAATLIDLSAVFGVPANAKAVALISIIRDSGSAGNSCYFVAGANNGVTWEYEHYVSGVPNDSLNGQAGVVPCDANGDIYYAIQASGAGTMGIWLRIIGYWI